MQTQKNVLRIYIREELLCWRKSHSHLLGPYNITETALVDYWLYLVELVLEAGWLVPNPENEFLELAQRIRADFCNEVDNSKSARDLFEKQDEINEITNIVVVYVAAMYRCSLPFLKDLITQPNRNFRLQVLSHDQVSILVEVLPDIDYVSQIPKPFVL